MPANSRLRYSPPPPLVPPTWPMPKPALRPENMQAGVYRLYNSVPRLLYVGYSYNPRKRYDDHRRNKSNPWRFKVHHDAPIDWYPTIADAKLAEITAMHSEHPLYNDGGAWAEHRFTHGVCPCGATVPMRQ